MKLITVHTRIQILKKMLIIANSVIVEFDTIIMYIKVEGYDLHINNTCDKQKKLIPQKIHNSYKRNSI